MSSPHRLARIAGLFYLSVVLFGVFAHLYVRAQVYVPGDAAATAENVVAGAGLVRMGFVADLVMATCFLFVALALHRLLEHVHGGAARAMVTFVAIAVAIICLNMVHQFGALLVATDESYTGVLDTGTSDALVLLLLDLQHYGYLVAQIFFGLWLLPLGYLAYRSGMFPRPLGVLLMIASFGYLVDTVASFLAPGIADSIAVFVRATTLAELWMVGYLLLKGVRTPGARLPAAQVLGPPAT